MTTDRPADFPLLKLALAALERHDEFDERSLGLALAGGWRPGYMPDYHRVARDTLRRLEAAGKVEPTENGWRRRHPDPHPDLLRPPA